MLTPVELEFFGRKTLRAQIRELIGAEILRGALEPGLILDEKQLQLWLGVSRTPIREAILDLVHTGLVSKSSGQRARVAAPTVQDAIEALQTYSVLFSGAVRLSIPRMPIPVREEVVAVLDFWEESFHLQNGGLWPLPSDLLSCLLEHCGNPSFRRLCDSVVIGIDHAVFLACRQSPARLQVQIEHIAELKQAILGNRVVRIEHAVLAFYGASDPGGGERSL